MSSLGEAPETLTDEEGRPRFGKYRGGLPRIPLEAVAPAFRPGWGRAWMRRKRWVFSSVATERWLLGAAAVDLGYGGNGFLYAVDLREREQRVDRTAMALPLVGVGVGDRPGEGFEAELRAGGLDLWWRRPEGSRTVIFRFHAAAQGRSPELRASGTLEVRPPPLSVVAPTPEGRVHVTQKLAGLPASGVLEIDGEDASLDGGTGGLDVSLGFPPRRTRWRWAMANGRLPDGTPVGFNLVEGFNEAPPAVGRGAIDESAFWIGDELLPLGPARFEAPREGRRTLGTADGALELGFAAYSTHVERRDYGLVSADFRQTTGVFSGRLLHRGSTIEVYDLAGVVEDQDVTW